MPGIKLPRRSNQEGSCRLDPAERGAEGQGDGTLGPFGGGPVAHRLALAEHRHRQPPFSEKEIAVAHIPLQVSLIEQPFTVFILFISPFLLAVSLAWNLKITQKII